MSQFCSVDVNELKIRTKNDVYQTVLIPVDRDYHGNMIYDHRTVWACIDDINAFQQLIDNFTPEEIIAFRDEYNGNIFASLAESNRDVRFFQVLVEKIGEENAYNMLLSYDRRHICPLALIRDLESFVVLLNAINIDADTLRQICHHGTNQVVDHLACMVNSASSIEVALNNMVEAGTFD